MGTIWSKENDDKESIADILAKLESLRSDVAQIKVEVSAGLKNITADFDDLSFRISLLNDR